MPPTTPSYMPHPQPSAADHPSTSMNGTVSVLKTVLVPAFISLAIYLLFSYLILPWCKRHRHRYDQYLPLDRLSSQTTSLQQRLSDAAITLLMPSSWARDRHHRMMDGLDPTTDDDNSSLFDDTEGEHMVGFEIHSRRREALDFPSHETAGESRRLSRDLEEGFRDDSDDNDDGEANDTNR